MNKYLVIDSHDREFAIFADEYFSHIEAGHIRTNFFNNIKDDKGIFSRQNMISTFWGEITIIENN